MDDEVNKNAHTKQKAANQSTLYNDHALSPLPVCQLSRLWPVLLWALVMPCCPAHIFSTLSPLSILTRPITVPISATPRFVYPHSTLSVCFKLFLKLQPFGFVVWALIWQPVTLQNALLSELVCVKTFRGSKGAFSSLQTCEGPESMTTGLFPCHAGDKKSRELRQKQISRMRRNTEHSFI